MTNDSSTVTDNPITSSLVRFCTKEFSRFDLDQPFYHPGWCYATDGRILVRRRTDIVLDATETERRFPIKSAIEMFEDFPGCRFCFPKWNGMFSNDECLRCSGLRTAVEECRSCEGDGHYEYEEQKCRVCRGYGLRPQPGTTCPRCQGVGFDPIPMQIGPKLIDGYYVRLINELEQEVQAGPAKWNTSPIRNSTALSFRIGDEVQGLVCELAINGYQGQSE